MRVVRCLDLTSLSEENDEAKIEQLCRNAISPLPATNPEVAVAAVCVRSEFANFAAALLKGSGVAVAAVAAGFPRPNSGLRQRQGDIRQAVEAGADEIDAVITHERAQAGDWSAIYEEVSALKEACGPALLKVIIVTGELAGAQTIARAALACMMSGADFVKTSTGYDHVNATLDAGFSMASAIRSFHVRTGYRVGLKPAGGIRTAEQALGWLHLARRELGEEWLTPSLFRIGASSPLEDIARTLDPRRYPFIKDSQQ